MSESEAGRDLVYIDHSVHEAYKRMTGGNDPESMPFRHMKDVFMWAMALGYKNGLRQPLNKKKAGVFRWAQFSPQVDIPFIKAVALLASQDVHVLLNREQLLTIAEEYANAGIHQLNAHLSDGSGQLLWKLVEVWNSSLATARSSRNDEHKATMEG